MLQYSCSFNQLPSHRTSVPASPLKAHGEKQVGNVHFKDPGGRKGLIWYALISSISHNVLIAVLSVVLIWTGRHSPDDKFNWNQTWRCLWSYFFFHLLTIETQKHRLISEAAQKELLLNLSLGMFVCLFLYLVLIVHKYPAKTIVKMQVPGLQSTQTSVSVDVPECLQSLNKCPILKQMILGTSGNAVFIHRHSWTRMLTIGVTFAPVERAEAKMVPWVKYGIKVPFHSL